MTLSKNHFIFFIVFALSFFSCQDQTSTSTEVLNKEKMVQVLVDVYQLEATVYTLDKSKNCKDIFNTFYLPSLLEEHCISKANFDSSYAWYLSHHEEGIALMEELKDSLENRKLKKILYTPNLDTLNK